MYLYDRACLSLQTVGFLLSAIIIAVLRRMLMRMAMKLGHNAFFFSSVCLCVKRQLELWLVYDENCLTS